MNTFAALAFCSASFALAAHAQLSPIPPSSQGDGIHLGSHAANPSHAAWQSSPLFDYRVAPDHVFHTPAAGTTDNYGRTWGTHAPDKTPLNQSGGVVRAIFLGATNGWLDAAGYSYDGSPAGNSFSLWSALDSPAPTPLSFGDHADVPFAIGEAGAFDFWLYGASNAYSLFEPANSLPGGPAGSVRWTTNPLLVPTYLPTLDAFVDVATWIVSVDDSTNPDAPSGYRFAVQLFYYEGGALVPLPAPAAVPEPAAFGLAGMIAAACAAAWRSRTRRRT